MFRKVFNSQLSYPIKGGITGFNCEITPCDTSPCFYGGECSFDGPLRSCACLEGYSGENCEITPCDGNNCENGSECVLVDNTYECKCSSHFYKGEFCEETPCSNKPCGEFGVCKENFNAIHGFICDCFPGFFGLNCENDPCSGEPCKNGAECSILGPNFRCNCPAGKKSFLNIEKNFDQNNTRFFQVTVGRVVKEIRVTKMDVKMELYALFENLHIIVIVL